jgi:hypothetical protein
MLMTIVGMFGDTTDARRAVYDLEEGNFPSEGISVAMRDSPASAFSSSGSLLSIAISNQASTTAMDQGKLRPGSLLPGELVEPPELGHVVAAGPLAASLGGAALGVAAGGLTGGLTNIGIPNETARELINRVRAGTQTLVAIKVAPEDAPRVEGLFLQNGAAEVYVNKSHSRSAGEGERSIADAQVGF